MVKIHRLSASTYDKITWLDSLRIFTRDELSEFSGKNNRLSDIGYRGKVYDVTGSFHWKNGDHWVLHHPGTHLTREMKDAPHFDDLLAPFQVIGILEIEE